MVVLGMGTLLRGLQDGSVKNWQAEQVIKVLPSRRHFCDVTYRRMGEAFDSEVGPRSTFRIARQRNLCFDR